MHACMSMQYTMIIIMSLFVETCEALSDVNGVITYEPATNTPVARTVATYTCNEGYRLDGQAKRVCQGSSGWTGIQPLCVGKNVAML